MRLHRAQVPQIAAEMVKALVADDAIECEDQREVQVDLESVLNEYVRTELDIAERARTLLAKRNLPQSEFGRMRRLVAEEQKVALGDEAIDYLLTQLVEILMHSRNVDEVFAEDHELRRRMREPLRRQAAADEQLNEQVRARLKHVQEGTSLWEVEYQRMMADIKRRKGW